jgi:hypothetical protein
MLARLAASIIVGAIAASVPDMPSRTTMLQISDKIEVAAVLPPQCEGCFLANDVELCANCTFSASWGAGSSAGTCAQVTPCGPTATQCMFGAVEVTVHATSPGCTINWWEVNQWGADQTLNSGSLSKRYGSASNPVGYDCGGSKELVKCGTSTASIKCTKCTG